MTATWLQRTRDGYSKEPATFVHSFLLRAIVRMAIFICAITHRCAACHVRQRNAVYQIKIINCVTRTRTRTNTQKPSNIYMILGCLAILLKYREALSLATVTEYFETKDETVDMLRCHYNTLLST